jgi:hypothetical protein
VESHGAKYPRASLAALDKLVTTERVWAYAVILLLGYAIGAAFLLATMRHGLDAQGEPPGTDFIIVYGVSVLTLSGRAALAYALHAPIRLAALWCGLWALLALLRVAEA